MEDASTTFALSSSMLGPSRKENSGQGSKQLRTGGIVADIQPCPFGVLHRGAPTDTAGDRPTQW